MEADETISGVTVIAYEVTLEVIAKKRIEESEKQFREMAELMPQKIYTADSFGNKNYFNQKLIEYTGLTFDELKSTGWRQMVHPDDWEETTNKWERSISTGEDYEMESRLLRKDGKYLWHLTRATALKDEEGKIKLWIGSKTEIQEQKKQKQVLETEVAKRTNELIVANEELLKINKELEAFAYVSSHDLQEPLRKIQTFASRIIQKENENLSAEGKDYFKRMQNAAARMQQLIEDLLAFSRLNTSQRKFELVPLKNSIDEAKAELKETIEEKKAVIETNQLCDVKIIPFQFRQLMHNLMSNALKFSAPEIPPHIIINCSIEIGGDINNNYLAKKPVEEKLSPDKNYNHIMFKDNGIGFEPEYSEKIFQVFQKLHDKDMYKGTGIGLAIVKKIVDNHNGVIIATSSLKKGVTFDIFIPNLK
jgi:PAS domain S-box-containing protein